MVGNMVGNVAFPIFPVTDAACFHAPAFALPRHGSTKKTDDSVVVAWLA
jgi:hypothetical protein